MGRRLVGVLLGAVWVIGGALMAFNPPPHDFRRAATLPFIGWMTMAFGIYIVVKLLRPPDVADSGKPPRHASGQETSVRDAVKVVVGIVFLTVCGGFAAWAGIHRGLLSLVGLGITILGMELAAIPLAASVLNWLLRRRR